MALGSNLVTFNDGAAWVQINFDDVALNIVSVAYQNATNERAIVDVSQGARSDHIEVLPGAGVPTPITQAIPKNRYSYSPDPNDPTGIIPNFSLSVAFRA